MNELDIEKVCLACGSGSVRTLQDITERKAYFQCNHCHTLWSYDLDIEGNLIRAPVPTGTNTTT